MSARSFGPNTTADEVLAGIDLNGKRALVTGASGGLGAETARALAARGAEVVATARDQSKMNGVVESIRASTGKTIQVESLELGSLASVRRLAERLQASARPFDIVIANAGIMACPQGKTDDGFELQFGTNHLGHFLLVNLLVPQIADRARIVSVSSLAHRASPLVFDDIQFERRPYEKWSAYGQSKTANALFAVALDARLRKRGIEAFSLHPGAIETDLGRYQSDADRERSRAARESGKIHYKSVTAGASTQLYAATAPELIGKGGAYLADCAIAPRIDDPATLGGVRSYALDREAAERLWTISEAMLVQRFAY